MGRLPPLLEPPLIPVRVSLKKLNELPGGLGDWEGFVVDDDQLALRKRFFQIENEEIFLLLRNAEIRNKRDPQADFRQIDEQIIAAQFNLVPDPTGASETCCAEIRW